MGVEVAVRRLPGKRGEALAFVEAYILRTGNSPSLGDIAAGLKVSRGRAKTLVDQLTVIGEIVRAPGSQRAITVPGLIERDLIARLRAAGAIVNEDFLDGGLAGALPQVHLPLVAIIEHIPDPVAGDPHAEPPEV